MTVNLRWYQEEAVNSIYHYFMNGGKGNPIIGLPTGSGKTLLPNIFMQRVLNQWPNQKFLVLTHIKELLSQAYDNLLKIWPSAPAGIYSAGIGRKDVCHPIIFAGIQSAVKQAMLFGHRDIIFCDECHMISTDENSMYQNFLAVMKLINPNVKFVGLSATLYRMGQGQLIDGGLFTDVIYNMTDMEGFNKLIEEGYLLPLVPLRMRTQLDTSDVGIAKGDFILSQLEKKVDVNEITYEALREACEHGKDRKSWLIFSSGIDHAEHISSMLQTFGIDCAAVHSKQTKEYNDRAIRAFKSGELKALTSYSKLHTGFDSPAIDLIIDLRPTMSVPLHVQKYGRGTRPVYADGFDLNTIEGRFAAIKASPKQNCIAEGSLVLTDTGLVSIEKITLDMKLWDGYNFVSHDGIVYKGEQRVISYDGLTATPDHQVFTEKGWTPFWECVEKKFRIAVTGVGGKTIQLSDNNFNRNSISETFLYSNSMRNLQENIFQRFQQCHNWKSWLPQMWKFQWGFTQMVIAPNQCSTAAMYKPEQYSLREIRKAWDRVSFFFSPCYGEMGSGKSRVTSREGNRQNKKQWSLRSWKFAVFNASAKPIQYKSKREVEYINAPLPLEVSAHFICRQYIKKFICTWSVRGSNLRKIQEKNETKRVWDIINAGPRHSFTVNGRLVHNCLALDYGKNTSRLGFINDPLIPRKKGTGDGTVPVKVCDFCGVFNHIKNKTCSHCASEFSFEIKITKTAGFHELIKSDLPIYEDFEVDRVIYSKHQKSVVSTPCLKITYYTGIRSFNEWLFPQSTKGPGKHFFHQWWKQRSEVPPPLTVEDALGYCQNLKKPKTIKVWVNKLPSPSIEGVQF